MVFRELNKWLNNHKVEASINTNIVVNDEQNKQQSTSSTIEGIKLVSEKFKIYRDKPYWISNVEEHKAADKKFKGLCCVNHILGLPRKNGVEYPIFDYEQQVVNALNIHYHVWIKKARGLGITEILLRYMGWLAVRNSNYAGKRFHIVIGPRIDLAEELINRIRLLFAGSKICPIELKTSGPIIYLNGVTIEAFPSHHVDAMRGYTDANLQTL